MADRLRGRFERPSTIVRIAAGAYQLNCNTGRHVARDSPLPKKIDEALLAVYQDGIYDEIYGRWFAQGR